MNSYQVEHQLRFRWIGDRCPSRHLFEIERHVLLQVISHQVITGEQGDKYCETLPALFERHDSEFSGGVPIEKTNIDIQS